MSTAAILGLLVMVPAIVGIVVLWRWSGPSSAELQPPPTADEVVAKARQVLGRLLAERPLLPVRRPRQVRLAPVPPRHGGAHRRLPRYAPMPTMHAPATALPVWSAAQPSVAQIRAREDADHLSYYGGPRRP